MGRKRTAKSTPARERKRETEVKAYEANKRQLENYYKKRYGMSREEYVKDVMKTKISSSTTDAELKQLADKLARLAKTQYEDLKKAAKKAPMAPDAKERYEEKIGKIESGLKSKNRDEIRNSVKELKYFLSRKSSTVKGAKELQKSRNDAAKKWFGNDWADMSDGPLALYNTLKSGKVARDSRGRGYVKVAEFRPSESVIELITEAYYSGFSETTATGKMVVYTGKDAAIKALEKAGYIKPLGA